MKGFIAAALLSAATAVTIPIPDISTLTTIQYNEMLAGIVYGILDKNNETAIETCLIDGENTAIGAFGVFEDYRHGNFIKGTRDLHALMAQLPTLKLACSEQTLMPDFISLEQWGLFFDRPEADVEADIQRNVIRHSLVLTKDLHTAEGYWNAAEFFKFGEELGIMAVIATQ